MPPVVVINQAMAKTYFGDQSPLGKKMQIGATPDNEVPWMMVVGVVGNIKQTLVSDMPTEMYVPFRQANEVLPVRNMSFVMRTEVDPRSLIPELRDYRSKINPNQPVVQHPDHGRKRRSEFCATALPYTTARRFRGNRTADCGRRRLRRNGICDSTALQRDGNPHWRSAAASTASSCS